MELGVHVVPSGRIWCNSIVVWDRGSRDAVLIDPSDDATRVLAWIASQQLCVRKILVTHAHPDHVADLASALSVLRCSAMLHPADLPACLDLLGSQAAPASRQISPLVHGQSIDVAGSFALQVLHLPGHSPGSVGFHVAEQGWLFCGDTLFYGGVGRTDIAGGDSQALTRSIRDVLYALPDDCTVYPGHGPTTTIGEEKRNNPFVRA